MNHGSEQKLRNHRTHGIHRKKKINLSVYSVSSVVKDKFDALTTSLTEGLPRKIELRQKQYEYYRDLLLSFPKPEEAAA